MDTADQETDRAEGAHLDHDLPPAPPHHPTRRERRHRKKMLLLVIGGAAALLLLAGAGVYWFVLRDKDAKAPAQASTTEQSTSAETAPPPSPTDATPVSFKSTKLNIEITHRKDWTLKEKTDGELELTSPRISYTGADGESTTGVFTLKLRKGVSATQKATIEQAVASRDSEVIAYAAPTEQQRYYTNVSYAGQKDTFNFFIVTGSAELKAGNPFMYTLVLDSEFYLIVGGYGTDKNGSLAFDPVPKTSLDSPALQQAIDIVESLKIY